MKTIYTQYLPNREVRFTTEPFVSEDWPKAYRVPRVEVLSDGKAWLYHAVDGDFAWSIIGNLDKALEIMMKETP